MNDVLTQIEQFGVVPVVAIDAVDHAGTLANNYGT